MSFTSYSSRDAHRAAMTRRAHAITMAIGIAAGLGPGQAAEQRRPACLSQVETREAIEAHKLVPPVRAMAEAVRTGGGESVGLRLCRLGAVMVYDVAILRHDGHLVHVFVDAGTGVARAD